MREIRDGDHRTGAARCARRANLDRNDAKRTQALFAKRLKWPPTFGAVRLQCRQLGDIRRNPPRLVARVVCCLESVALGFTVAVGLYVVGLIVFALAVILGSLRGDRE